MALLGIGSGVLKIPAMDTAMRLPIKVSSATSSFMIGVTAAASAAVYFMRGVIVTARSDTPHYDFVSRFFAPGAGIDEDPVTGSAHCCLGPFWAARLGKTDLVGYQASARGGVVRVRLEGERVKLGGQAVTVLRGELVL